MNYSELAKEVIKNQSLALEILKENLPADFDNLIKEILNLKGRVILTGMGKSGYIAQKISASLSSTGTPSLYVHPGEASHGDLGMITDNDLVIMISNSGETKELFDTINYCKRFNIKIAAITMKIESTLAQNSSFLLLLPKQKESSNIAAPTTSALMTLSLGDAIVTSLHEAKGFTADDFKIFHPGGKIGANLMKVKDVMKKGSSLPVMNSNTSIVEAILTITNKCLGCGIVVDNDQHILGIITDGDLRRHIYDDLNNVNAIDIMTKNPEVINDSKMVGEALYIMQEKSITALPVVNDNKLVGILHIHDLLKIGV